jgi:hypothetical protein
VLVERDPTRTFSSLTPVRFITTTKGFEAPVGKVLPSTKVIVVVDEFAFAANRVLTTAPENSLLNKIASY